MADLVLLNKLIEINIFILFTFVDLSQLNSRNTNFLNFVEQLNWL